MRCLIEICCTAPLMCSATAGQSLFRRGWILIMINMKFLSPVLLSNPSHSLHLSLETHFTLSHVNVSSTHSSFLVYFVPPRAVPLTSSHPCRPLCSLAAPGVFLICWLPFFVTHILNTHCRTCYVPPGLYSAFTWLGYVNSALNPIIYTTFNIEFRRAFIKILTC